MRVWGTIRFYSADREVINERRYYTTEGRFEMILREREAEYYHILPEWVDRGIKIISDAPKEKIIRPKAVYDNRKTLYDY